jgi:hypothetical protein
MKKLFVLAFLVLMALILMNRQRVYVRDPLAKVYRNDQKQNGVQVYINYSNDVLLIKEGDPGAYRILLQNWSKSPGTPTVLKCIHWMACLADADHATVTPIVPIGKGSYDPRAAMNNREISFVNADGSTTRIELR